MDEKLRNISIQRANIFDGKDVAVFSIRPNEPVHGTLITFGSWLNIPYDDTPIDNLKGFGQKLFSCKGIKEIHIIPRKNNWYQSSEMSEVLSLIQPELETQNIWTYGGSMGGYAAINFSGKIKSSFIAFCPQFSVDKDIVPFENRWIMDRAMIDFKCDYLHNDIAQSGFIFYDPYSLDNAHAKLIKNHTNAVLIPCPFSGHKVLNYIQEIFGLFGLVIHILNHGSIPSAFYSEQRKNRGVSKVYLDHLYKYCLQRKKTRKNLSIYTKFLDSIYIKIKNIDL